MVNHLHFPWPAAVLRNKQQPGQLGNRVTGMNIPLWFSLKVHSGDKKEETLNHFLSFLSGYLWWVCFYSPVGGWKL